MKTCLLTGHTGFLGQHILKHLEEKYRVIKVGRNSGDVICDLSKAKPSISDQIDLVVHAAGKAHSVPKTEEEKQEFLNVNFKGTINLFDGIADRLAVDARIVFISTVGVYGEHEGLKLKENRPLLATAAYALGKIKSEKWLDDFAASKQLSLTVFRLPLVAGKNAPGNLGAMIRGISTGKYLSIGGGKASKSMVLANDVGKLIASEALQPGTFHLTDGVHPTFRELEKAIATKVGKPIPRKLPVFLANILGIVGDIIGSKFPVNSNAIQKITSDLTFDDTKAREQLNWNPQKVLQNTDWIN